MSIVRTPFVERKPNMIREGREAKAGCLKQARMEKPATLGCLHMGIGFWAVHFPFVPPVLQVLMTQNRTGVHRHIPGHPVNSLVDALMNLPCIATCIAHACTHQWCAHQQTALTAMCLHRIVHARGL